MIRYIIVILLLITTNIYAKSYAPHIHKNYLDGQAGKYVTKGNELLDNRKYEAAIAQYDKALKLSPKSAIYRDNKAYTLYEMGQYKEAMNEVNKALELDSNMINAYKLKALVEDKLK